MKRRALDLVVALAFALAAFLLRSLPGAGDVMGARSVRFRTPDPLYHMRIVDLLVERFPRPVRHDDLLLWPHGQDLTSGPLFDYMIAVPAMILGGRHPPGLLLDRCGAFVPPLLGAFLVAAVWLLGRRLFGRAGAALSAALAAVMPGQLLQRTALGYTDHHAIALLALAVFVLYVARGAADPDEAGARKEAARAGAALAVLVLSWPWGAAFAGVAALWSILDTVFRKESRALGLVSRAAAVAAAPTLLAAVVFPVLRKPAGALVLVALATAAGSRARGRVPRLLVWAALLAAAIGVAVVRPDLLREAFLRLRPSPTRMTVAEAAPLWTTGAGLDPLLRELWTGLFAMVLGAGLAIRSLRSRRESGLLLVFLGVTVSLAIVQVRFGGELAIVVALLGGLVPGHFLAGKANLSRGRELAGRGLVFAGLATLIVVPAALVAPAAIRGLPVEDPDWDAAMSWLRAGSPEPFFPSRPGSAAAYSVLSWWDNGYLVVRRGGRVPVTNPTQEEAGWAARALLAEDEAAAGTLLASRAVRYVALDSSLPFLPRSGGGPPIGQFRALPVWAGIDPGRYFARVSERGDRKTAVFFAEYYRTLAYRLWRFGGYAATAAGPALAVRVANAGNPGEIRRFPAWEEADRFVRSASPQWRLACADPITPCVPLEAWPRFHRAYSSPRDALRGPAERVARVEILMRDP